MITCPSCGHENIQGVDCCEECGTPLVEESRPKRTSPVERSLLKDVIAELEPAPALTVRNDQPVSEVLQFLIDHKIGCVLVVDDQDALVGVFSERDALTRLNVGFAELRSEPVSNFMTPKVESLEMDDKIAHAVQKMDVGGYRHIPILRDGKLAGIISVRDILRYIAGDLLRMES